MGSIIPRLISAAEGGDTTAAEELFGVLYSELHRMARNELARHSPMLGRSPGRTTMRLRASITWKTTGGFRSATCSSNQTMGTCTSHFCMCCSGTAATQKKAQWSYADCQFLGVTLPEDGGGYDPKFALAKNSGDYQVKALLVGILARSIKFNVDASGKFDTGIAVQAPLTSRGTIFRASLKIRKEGGMIVPIAETNQTNRY